MGAWLALLPLFILPACAALGGLVTWALTRGEKPEDGVLLRTFLVSTLMFVLVSVAVPRTEWFRDRYDPLTKARKVLHAHPVNAALRDHKAWEWKEIDEAMAAAAVQGIPPAQILAPMRVRHMALARKYMPWAPGVTVNRQGEALLAAMQELRAAQPELCVRLAWPRAGAPFDVVPHLSPATAAAYEAALAEIVARADLSHGAHERYVQQNPDNAGVGVNELQAGFVPVREKLQAVHGDIVRKLWTPEVVGIEPGAACDMSIALYAETLAQEPRLSHSLLRNYPRY